MSTRSHECAVIGAGPAGFYCAQALLQGREDLGVTLLDRLPAAYGLARYGVAPDHLKLKQVCNVFESLLRHPRLRLVGNVEVPGDVPLDFLREHFDAVVLATGAPVARRLHIPGESLAGSHSAADFVAWYNGHPCAASLAPALQTGTAVVIGQGNVALDVARVLVMPGDRRVASDMAVHALEALRASRVRQVHVIGRRGPWRTRFSPKELRELESLSDVALHVHFGHGDASAAAPAGIDDAARGAGEFFLRHAATPGPARSRSIHFHFGYVPTRFVGDGVVSAVQFAAAGRGDAAPLTLDCGLVIPSIGTHCAPIGGLTVNPAHGGLANRAGRAVAPDGKPIPGVYVTGWARRGATGVIGTNRDDGFEVAAAVLQDLQAMPPAPSGGAEALVALLHRQGRATIDGVGWMRIDAAERAAGQRIGRPRLKLVRIPDLLAAAQEAVPEPSPS